MMNAHLSGGTTVGEGAVRAMPETLLPPAATDGDTAPSPAAPVNVAARGVSDCRFD